MPKAVREAQPQEGSVRVRAVAPLDVAYTQGSRALWSKGAVRLMSMPLPASESFRPLSGSAGAVSVHQSPESEAAAGAGAFPAWLLAIQGQSFLRHEWAPGRNHRGSAIGMATAAARHQLLAGKGWQWLLPRRRRASASALILGLGCSLCGAFLKRDAW